MLTLFGRHFAMVTKIQMLWIQVHKGYEDELCRNDCIHGNCCCCYMYSPYEYIGTLLLINFGELVWNI